MHAAISRGLEPLPSFLAGAAMQSLYCFVDLVLIFSLGQKTASIPLADFYPFGIDNGDISNRRVDDGSSGLIQLSFRFPFFETDQTSLYVNNNGLISFDVEVSQFTSRSFPLGDGRMIIAPYWADTNIRISGMVLHRETSDPNLLARAGRQIRSAFVSQMNFEPTWLYIATWNEVPYFGGNSSINNTFQCVLVTDQVRSFAIFNYADGQIRWTTGDASGGRGGLGGTEAQVGFNAGDGIRYFNVPGSQTRDILNIDTTSNVGVAGLWVFRVDEEEMIPPPTCTMGNGVALSIGPRSGSQFGGTAIYVSGPCFDENDVISCFFGDDVESGIPGYYMSNTTAVCVSPIFETPGWKTLRVGIGMGQMIEYTGRSRFYAENPDSTTHIRLQQETLLLRVDSEEQLNITWDPQSLLPTIDPSLYTVDITLYRFQLDADNQVQFSYFLHVMRDHTNNGTALFTAPESNESGGNIYPVVIRVSVGTPTSASNSETSSMISRFGRSGDSVAQWTSTMYYLDSLRFQTMCTDWSRNQEIGEAVRNRLPPCPPRIDQARAPNSGLSEDSGYWIEKSNRFFHPMAATCFRQNSFDSTHMGSGQQCCYRQNGSLLFGARSGGTVDSVAPIGLTNSVRHFYDDIIPAVFCCKGYTVDAMNPCGVYYEHRPSDNGSRYNPPPPACVYGDPHIVTLDGFKYTFNGLGEYTLVETGDDSFTLQGRMVQALDSAGNVISATVFSAIVGKELYSDTVQFQLAVSGEEEEESDVNVLVNGELLDFENLAEQQLINVTVAKGDRSASAVFSTGIYVEVRAANRILSTLLVSMAESYRSQTRGLMGNYNGDQSDDLRPRAQSTLIPLTSSLQDIHNRFGVTWIVNRVVDSLFTYGEDESWNTFYNPFFQPEFEPVFNNSELEQEANAICGDDPFCLFDIAATSRTDIGLTTLLGNIEFEVISNISRPVVCSPPCQSGVCVQNDTCSCADGFTGATCAESIVRECDVNPCVNGGTCTLIATSYVCSCLDGYSGLFCEESEAPPFSGSGDVITPFDCTCSRDVECSLIGQLKNSQVTPITNELKCTIMVEPEPTVREKIVVDSTFNSRYLSPGSLSFLASIGVLQRDRGFSSCMIDGSGTQPFLEDLGIEFLSIIYTKPDGSFGSLEFTMSSLQEIMSGRDDFTIGVELDEVNLCSLLNLLQWIASPQPSQVSTCRDTASSSDSDTTIAYFPVNCGTNSLAE